MAHIKRPPSVDVTDSFQVSVIWGNVTERFTITVALNGGVLSVSDNCGRTYVRRNSLGEFWCQELGFLVKIDVVEDSLRTSVSWQI
jgi:hypothetical protein